MDLYQEVTNRIMEQLENGLIPWQNPWISTGNAVSHATGKPYSLLNQMLLGRPGEYVTFKQCQQEGGKVRKGEKSQMVVFWKWIETEDEETGEKKELPNRPQIHRWHYRSYRIRRYTALAAQMRRPHTPRSSAFPEYSSPVAAATGSRDAA